MFSKLLVNLTGWKTEYLIAQLRTGTQNMSSRHNSCVWLGENSPSNTINCICAWNILYHYPSNLEIESPILLQLGYLNWQSSFGPFLFKIWWMICIQNLELISYFLHFVCHLSLAHRQSRTYQHWQIFAIPCKKVKEKGKDLSWIRGIHYIS